MDTIKQFKPAALPTTKGEPYFWGLQIPVQQPFRRIEAGYQEARRLSVNGTFQTYERLLSISLSKLAEIYNGVDSPTLGDKGTVAGIRALQTWRRKQFDLGRIVILLLLHTRRKRFSIRCRCRLGLAAATFLPRNHRHHRWLNRRNSN
jgi:hypothetical protein